MKIEDLIKKCQTVDIIRSVLELQRRLLLIADTLKNKKYLSNQSSNYPSLKFKHKMRLLINFNTKNVAKM